MRQKSRTMESVSPKIPHQGALCCRYDNNHNHNNTRNRSSSNGSNDDYFESETLYVIEIQVANNDDDEGKVEQQHKEIAATSFFCHELCYTRKDFEFAQRLFAILDTENNGLVERGVIQEFVTLRCPVFWRRDDDLRRLVVGQPQQHQQSCYYEDPNDSPTFQEIWNSVVLCSKSSTQYHQESSAAEGGGAASAELIGVEGWMVFCRFIALAQYLEAKRRFSARHLQQTMRHRNAPRGSELVMVDVPPPTAPASLSPRQLASYEHQCKAPLPLPELDLDHSLLAAHDTMRRIRGQQQQHVSSLNQQGHVKINLFGPPSPSFSTSLRNTSGSSSNSANTTMEFAVTYIRAASSSSSSNSNNASVVEEVVVRRSMADMKWLNDTFASHKVLGGTLCGRILPPFPGSSLSKSSSGFQNEDSVVTTSIKSTGDAITAAAASGVGKVKNFAKSILESYLPTTNSGVGFGVTFSDDLTGNNHSSSTTAGSVASAKKLSSAKKSAMAASSSSRIHYESYCNQNSAACRARQLERYLNYLLEHPALSTSFPLNTILKASQSGLEAAKESLDEITRTRKELRDQTPQLDDGKMSIPFWPTSSSANADSSHSLNLAWVRTAAQAAMALRVHGMLETTGMNSASARLQHASLPSFGTTARSSSWDDDDGNLHRFMQETVVSGYEGADGENNFEEGVISVQSELDSTQQEFGGGGGDGDGFDLLPLPVPAPERRILSAGSAVGSASGIARETRFHYGTSRVHTPYVDHEENTCHAFLGDIAVDENIDKLREVIGSVDNTLSRCLASLGGIVKAQRERQALHLGIVRGLDSWSGMRGKFISQRSLLKGVAGIEQSSGIYDEGDVAMIDDISWQTSLANSAVAAAEDVRSAVRVSRTAANAKAAASSAAFAAQNACDTGKFSNIDEARAAQTRASIAQSHAIHAAVVEHEAKSVKRRATLALAHDVKCWNVHRKRELLRSCIEYSRSQHEATRRAVDAWSSLRDGFIGTTIIPSAHERRPVGPPPPMDANNEATVTIYENVASSGSSTGPFAIVAVDHNALSSATTTDVSATAISTKEAEQPKEPDPYDAGLKFEAGLILPFATAAPIPEEEEDLLSFAHFSGRKNPDITRPSGSTMTTDPLIDLDATSHSKNDEILSGSMQSLIDGLMNWGGGFDADEEHFALPAGMAASIVLEETSGASALGS